MPRKKSSNGDGGVYPRQLADGTPVYDVRWSYQDRDGRTQRGGRKGFRSEREANQYRRQVIAAVDAGTYVPPSDLTLGAWLQQ